MEVALIHIFDSGVPTLFIQVILSMINADKHHVGNICSSSLICSHERKCERQHMYLNLGTWGGSVQ
jgi:hypothetical protein